MTETARLGLPLIAEAQAQKHVTHNEALLRLDAVVQMAVKDRDLTEPPDAPVDGDAWIVAAGAAGDWAGHDDEVVLRQAGGWVFLVPRAGWIAWIEDEGRLAIHDGTAWVAIDAASLGGRAASEYVTTDDLATATVGDADTVDGRHADEFALLAGATFSGGVTATSFTGDGGGLTNVNADYLGGRSPEAYARIAGADFTGEVSAARFSGDGGGLTGVDADTVGGHHASEFALLTGATFSGGVTATGFTGDGGGLTNVNADYLGGQSPEAYARLSGAAFTGNVSAAGFSGDGSGLVNVDAAKLGGRQAADYVTINDLSMASVADADMLDGRHASEFALLTGAMFSGRLGARTAYVGHPDHDRGAGGGTASLELGGWAGTWACNVHDGSGRVNFRWNATAGPQPMFVFNGDRAVEWDIDGWGGFGLSIRESDANPGAGNAVVFRTLFSVGRRGIKGNRPFILPSYSVNNLPDAAWHGPGALLFIPDENGGPAVAYSDGSVWRRMQDGQIVS